jgi:hypothetical protein
VLGHDLRNPLDVVQKTAVLLSKTGADEQVKTSVLRILRSCFNELLEHEVAQHRVLRGTDRLVLQAEPGLSSWRDGKRQQQLLNNLLTNALKYGRPDTPVRLTASAADNDVLISEHNQGLAINPAELGVTFEPLRRSPSQHHPEQSSSMGLGLFIARQVARAHGGDIDVRSGEDGTLFSARLPAKQEKLSVHAA